MKISLITLCRDAKLNNFGLVGVKDAALNDIDLLSF
jgi:hypothetical protein